MHKNIRARLRQVRKDDISSAYDVALLIVDECSRVFFDRTKPSDRKPNLVELFADAIRGVVSCLLPSLPLSELTLQIERPTSRRRPSTSSSCTRTWHPASIGAKPQPTP